MKSFIKNLGAALFSDNALRALYERRKLDRPEDGSRTSFNITVGIFLLFFAVTALVVAGWVPTDLRGYLANSEDLVVINDDQLQWRMSDPLTDVCEREADCRDTIVKTTPLLATTTPAAIDLLANHSVERVQRLLSIRIDASAFNNFSLQRAMVVSLPRYNFLRADAFVNGSRYKIFAEGERISLVVNTDAVKDRKQLLLNLLFTLEPGQRNLASVRNGEPVLVASISGYERFITFMANHRSDAAGAIGFVAKVAIAAFCLILFLIVDGSPESLGLALFMGFEAIAMSLGRHWIPFQFFPGGSFLAAHENAITNFCYQMGDIMKLYFLLQISRVARTGSLRWVAIGTLVSIPYGIFMEAAGRIGIPWVYLIPLSRDTIVGTIGMITCYRSAWLIRNQKLPWRMIALVIAGTAALFEALASHLVHSSLGSIVPLLQTIYTLLQANIGYLFALSTVVNISTLENRVRALSTAQARMLEVERELEIGRSVQQSLLTNPSIPSIISITCQMDPAHFVSGDTYFTDWDASAKTFTFILNDVTGHGIQAALKASATNVIAKTIWSKSYTHRGDVLPGSRILEFEKLNRELVCETDTIPDFHSMIAAEFDVTSRRLSVYRSNFTFPILLAPRPVHERRIGDLPSQTISWQVAPLYVPHAVLTHYVLHDGSFVLFLSDGLIDSSRQLKHFVMHLRTQLELQAGTVTPAHLSAMVYSYPELSQLKTPDDKTLMIFGYDSRISEPVKTVELDEEQKLAS